MVSDVGMHNKIGLIWFFTKYKKKNFMNKTFKIENQTLYYILYK